MAEILLKAFYLRNACLCVTQSMHLDTLTVQRHPQTISKCPGKNFVMYNCTIIPINNGVTLCINSTYIFMDVFSNK